jgi:hypothetical protein
MDGKRKGQPISPLFVIVMQWIPSFTTDSLVVLGIPINLYVSVLRGLLTEVVLPGIYLRFSKAS